MITKAETQRLILDTIVGPQVITAPAGWEFDSTATIVWARLLSTTRDAIKPGPLTPKRTKCEQQAIEAQVEILAIVLANALGMAAFYWTQTAREILILEAANG